MNKTALGKLVAALAVFASLNLGMAFGDSAKDFDQALRQNDLTRVRKIVRTADAEFKRRIALSFGFYLNLAARFGSVDLVKALLEMATEQTSPKILGDAMVTAADNDHFAEVIPFLLAAGASAGHEFSERTALGQLTLVQAGKESDAAASTIALLLKNGAYVDHFSDSGETPLMIACRQNDYKLAKVLLENGANPDLTGKGTPAARQLVKPGSRIAKLMTSGNFPKNSGLSLLDEQPNTESSLPRSKDPLNIYIQSHSSGQNFEEPNFGESQKMKLTQLSMAVATGDLEAAKQLLDEGLDVNADLDGAGITPIMQAEKASMVKLLLDAGADVKKTDVRGWNCLHHAATRNGETLAIGLLIKAGADVNQKNADGEAPLHLSRLLFTEAISPEWGRNLLPILVNAGANIDEPDNMGQTLLHCAATNDNADLAEVCLLLGADPDRITSYEKSPRELAGSLKARAVQKVFSRHGKK